MILGDTIQPTAEMNHDFLFLECHLINYTKDHNINKDVYNQKHRNNVISGISFGDWNLYYKWLVEWYF